MAQIKYTSSVCTCYPRAVKNCIKHDTHYPHCHAYDSVKHWTCTCHPEMLQARDREGMKDCQQHNPSSLKRVIESRPLSAIRHYHCTCSSAHELDSRVRWVKGLKEGDKVQLGDRRLPPHDFDVAVVHRNIQSGYCLVDGKELSVPVVIVTNREGEDLSKKYYFDQFGILQHVEIAEDPLLGGDIYIAPVDQARLDEAERKNLVEWFKKQPWDAFSLEKLRRMQAAR